MTPRSDIARWRGVETPCERCGGLGVRGYNNSSTWRYGMGAAAITTDTCDTCWGTGDAERRGMDLRTIDAEVDRRARELCEARWRTLIGQADSATIAENVELIAATVEKLARKRSIHFWGARAAEYVASILRGTAPRITGSNNARTK